MILSEYQHVRPKEKHKCSFKPCSNQCGNGYIILIRKNTHVHAHDNGEIALKTLITLITLITLE
jgi:hypothetical protein